MPMANPMYFLPTFFPFMISLVIYSIYHLTTYPTHKLISHIQ